MLACQAAWHRVRDCGHLCCPACVDIVDIVDIISRKAGTWCCRCLSALPRAGDTWDLCLVSRGPVVTVTPDPVT